MENTPLTKQLVSTQGRLPRAAAARCTSTKHALHCTRQQARSPRERPVEEGPLHILRPQQLVRKDRHPHRRRREVRRELAGESRRRGARLRRPKGLPRVRRAPGGPRRCARGVAAVGEAEGLGPRVRVGGGVRHSLLLCGSAGRLQAVSSHSPCPEGSPAPLCRQLHTPQSLCS